MLRHLQPVLNATLGLAVALALLFRSGPARASPGARSGEERDDAEVGLLLENQLRLLREIDALERRVRERRGTAERLQEQIRQAEERRSTASSRLDRARARVRRARDRVAGLLRLAAVLERKMGLDVVLAGADLQENLRTRRVSDALIREVAKAARFNRDREAALDELAAALGRIEVGLQERRAAAAGASARAEAAGVAYRARLEEIEGDPRLSAALAVESSAVRAALRERVSRHKAWHAARDSFSGQQGKLRWPFVPVRVVSGFGRPERSGRRRRVDLLHRGLVLELDRDVRRDGVSVRAVAWGRVAFAGSIAGYGETVVVDHGQGYHAVYAGFDELRTEVGAVVAPREPVGFFSPTASAPRIVFELWREGAPEDPRPWFRR